MANGKNEAECITCIHNALRDQLNICKRHSRVLPYRHEPYLICNDWQNRNDPSDRAQYYKERYFKESNVLYQYDIYFVTPVKIIARMEELPSIDD